MKIEKRTESLNKVRQMKKIPGVMFGKTIEPISIQLDEKPFNQMLNEKGMSQTFDVKLGNKKHLVYIKDVQRDVVKHGEFLNVKLHKVSKDDTITANIPLVILGKEKVEKPGVLISLHNDSLEVEFNVGSGVSNIQVDISNLSVGDSIAVKDLTIPEGLKVLTDANQTIISVSEKHYDEAELETETDVDPEDVEIITEKTEEE